MALLLKLAHVAPALTLSAGVIGRWNVLGRAPREARVDRELAHPFERLVVWSSMAILLAGLTARARGLRVAGLTTAGCSPR